MKVVFITEGGANIGAGHITRCMGLYDEFKKKGIKPYFVINDERMATDLLCGIDFKTYKSNRKGFAEIPSLVKNFDLAIIDSYRLTSDTYAKIKRNVRYLTCIDDNKRINYPPSMVINGTIYAKRLNYSRKDGIIYLLGPKYIPIRQEFKTITDKTIQKKITNILITFGRHDSKGMAYKILDFISSNFSQLKLNVVIGQHIQNKKIFHNYREYNDVYYYGCLGVKGILELMQVADVAISAGGQTLYELARVGVPTIGICTASTQIRSLKGWSESGFLRYCGWYSDKKLFKKIENSLTLLDYKKRIQMNRVGKRIVDGRGAERVADNILEWMEN